MMQPSWFTEWEDNVHLSLHVRLIGWKCTGVPLFYPICSCVAKTLCKKCHLLLGFVYLWCGVNKNLEIQTHLKRGLSEQPEQRQSLQAENAQSDKTTCVWSHNQSRSRTETMLSNSHHFHLPSHYSLASFRGFGHLCGFLCKTTVEQSKVSWISVSGNKRRLAATLTQYLLKLLPGESVFAEWQQQILQDKVLHIWPLRLAALLSSRHWQRIQGASLRARSTTFFPLPGGSWAAQCSPVKIFFH